MRYERWAPRYEAIRAEFGYPWDLEEAAAARLSERLPAEARVDPLARAARRLVDREVVIVGLAPGAGPPPVWRWPEGRARPALIAADGAAEVCLSARLVPDVVVTDLDGPVPSEVRANASGALVVVHAHGDNVPALERWVPEFPGELAGSWAGPPRGELLDVGGFTDGDRAAYLAEHVGARRIVLWGFDFARVGDAETIGPKRAKLRWAERLLAELAAGSSVPIERWPRSGDPVPYVPGPSTQ